MQKRRKRGKEKEKTDKGPTPRDGVNSAPSVSNARSERGTDDPADGKGKKCGTGNVLRDRHPLYPDILIDRQTTRRAYNALLCSARLNL
jgi:hypothetical protein